MFTFSFAILRQNALSENNALLGHRIVCKTTVSHVSIFRNTTFVSNREV
jgi:hypothetical protein